MTLTGYIPSLSVSAGNQNLVPVTGNLSFTGKVASLSITGSPSLDAATISAIADAVWNKILESGFSAQELVRILVSHAAGDATGLENGSPNFKSLDGTKNRITGTYVTGTRSVTNRDAS